MWKWLAAVVAFFEVGTLALVAPPKQATSNPSARARQQIARSGQQFQEASQQEKPCEGDVNRASDLCAQWKAADAAQQSADVALWIGILGSLIAACTLAAAWAAARWAKKAAIHTEESAREAGRSADAAEKAIGEAQRIGEAQTRAYLSIVECNATFSAGKLSIQPTFSNSGQSPALEVRWSGEVSLFVVGTETLRTGESNREYLKNSLDVPAQQKRQALYYDCGGFGLETPEIAAFSAGKEVAISVTITAFGKDVFGRKIEGRDDFIHIFRSAPADQVAYLMTLGSRLNPQPEQ